MKPKLFKLYKPLAFFDIESTGTNRKTDRIIDLAVVVVKTNRSLENHYFRVHPEMPIPPESTRIHGITDDDVKEAPAFREVVGDVLKVFEPCDLAGYNILHFDIPMLQEECNRAGRTFRMDGRRVLDMQRIYHKNEPRDLSAALRFYCSEFHLGAHSAIDDVLATIRVFEGQLKRYKDLPHDIDELAEYCNPRDPTWADRAGKLKWYSGEIVINFGRNQGCKLKELVAEDPSFLTWILRSDFPDDTREIVRDGLDGKWPNPPATG